MSELQHKIETIRKAMLMVGLPTSEIHWQSFAVLHEVAPDKRKELIAHLFDDGSGWFRNGICKRYSNYKTSLYLSPKGMPFYVGYAGHSGLYHDVMGVSQHKLNEAGWIHISAGECHIRSKTTTHQERWLNDNMRRGLTLRRDDAHRSNTPLAEAEKFDVMPMRELDWDRLERRIAQAMNPDMGSTSIANMLPPPVYQDRMTNLLP